MSAVIRGGVRDGFDVTAVRADFPILDQHVHGQSLVYLDNAATSQKPQCVIDALQNYYVHNNANVHRGVHCLSERATEAYESAREKVRGFINARSTCEVVFVRGATEAINLVASSYGRTHLKSGDEILITGMEHHSNIVPWQLLCEQIGCVLKVAPLDDEGDVIMERFEALLSARTKLVAVAHMSNALGTINPVADIIAMAHRQGVPVLLDGAQATSHMSVDVKELDVDFYVMSAHKMLGPTGIGVLYGKQALLESMPPYQGGGDMIAMVSFEKTVYNELPFKFEAGTPHIAGAIGMGAAIDYLERIGLDNIEAHERSLLDYATGQAEAFEGLRIIGRARNKASILSFTLEHVHPHDLGTVLDRQGIAIRAGHHCAMPVMKHFGVPATARASFALYNTMEEIDRLFEGLNQARDMFA